MADINHHSKEEAFIESDGVSYRGIVVFIVILAVTTFICQGIVVGMFKYMDAKAVESSRARSAMATPTGTQPPGPNLLTDEPANMKHFATTEDEALHTYGWEDKNAGVVRLPIHRAKELMLERGFPVAGQAPTEPAKAEVAKAEVKK
jgi:hypothetical protein